MEEIDKEMNVSDAEEEEEEENGNDSSSSDSDSADEEEDEEIKLNKQFLGFLQAIQANKYDYNSYVEMINVAKRLSDLEKLRISYELFSAVYPLSPDIWMDLITKEQAIASTPKEFEKLIVLFNRALNDYYSAEIALEYAQLALKLDKETSNPIWEELLQAYGYDYQNGDQIFKLRRDDLLAKEPESPERFKAIIKKYKQELLLPLKNIKKTYTEFKTFLKTNESYMKQHNIVVDEQKIEKNFKETLQILQKIKPFEENLETFEENSYTEIFQEFMKYIRNGKSLEEENVQILYERLVTRCCLNVVVWKEYIKYVQHRPANWLEDRNLSSWIFKQTDVDILNRGLRNCTWSEDLYIEKMIIFEREGKTKKEIQELFEESCSIEYRSPEPQVKLWLYYLGYMTRHTDFSNDDEKETLRKCFRYSWDSLGKLWDDAADKNCEILKFWGCLEYNPKKLNDPLKGKDLWETASKSGDNYGKSGFWIEFAKLEETRSEDAARYVYKKSMNSEDMDSIDVLIESWLRFERIHSKSPKEFKKCQDICADAKQYFWQNQSQNRNKGFKDRAPGGGHKRKHDATEGGPKKKVTKIEEPEEPKKPEIDKTKDNIRVFFSNLDFNLTEEELKKELSELAFISISIIKSNTGKSRGFGYAELEKQSDVDKALSMDRKLVNGRPIFISKCSREIESREKFKYATALETNKVFVKGLAYEVEKEDLEELFKPFGEIKDIRVVVNKNGRKKGIAYIEFSRESSARTSVSKLDQTMFFNKQITVAISNPPGDNRREMAPPSGRSSHLPPTGAKQRLSTSLIPTSVKIRQAETSEPQKPASSNNSVKSNDDFRKMFLK